MAETVLLTGITGFIAKHVALKLLNAGHAVRGTLRRLDRAEEVRRALAPHLTEPAALERMDFVQADLESDAGWPQAMAGITALMHTASPFPIQEPRDPQDLIRPAREGTLRVLGAARAAGVGRVILTSSVVAIVSVGKPRTHDETDWTDLTMPGVSAYARSKTLAERAAWDYVASPEAAAGAGMALTTINPGWVVGPPLDAAFGDSVGLIRRILSGKDPMMPDVRLPFVDVRDVAEMHLRALQRPETAGKRFIAASTMLSFPQVGQILKAAYPDRRIATRTAPRVLMQVMSLFDRQIRASLPVLGKDQKVTSARAEHDMDMRFIPADAAIRAAADWLVAHRVV